jgi:hypothetical protein
VEAGDAGTYKAEAVNTHGKDTSEAKVSIKGRALISKLSTHGMMPLFFGFEFNLQYNPQFSSSTLLN